MAETGVLYESGMLKKWLNILQDIPALTQLGAPTLCATVYYPIALLKMKLLEYSYEDFDAVEQAILRFCSVGVNTPAALCRWMGLPSQRYVSERLALLTAENLLRGGQPTQLGKDSLAEGRKKQLHDGEQIFQADGILGLLLPKEFQKQLDHLKARGETRHFPHLMHSDAIAEETIRASIQGQDKLRAYKEYRKDILNVNVEQVQSVRFHELRYMLVLLVQFKGTGAPLVFLPRYQRDRQAGGRFYSDAPLFVPQTLAKRVPALAAGAKTVPDADLEHLIRLCAMLKESVAAVQPQDVSRWLEENTAFMAPVCVWQGERLCVQLNVKPNALFAPLDLELMAAAAQAKPCPVELALALPTENGGVYHTRLTVWSTAGRLIPEAAELAAGWAAKSFLWLKNKKPRTRDEIQDMLLEQEEDHERG